MNAFNNHPGQGSCKEVLDASSKSNTGHLKLAARKLNTHSMENVEDEEEEIKRKRGREGRRKEGSESWFMSKDVLISLLNFVFAGKTFHYRFHC